jgi:hypothetical protein
VLGTVPIAVAGGIIVVAGRASLGSVRRGAAGERAARLAQTRPSASSGLVPLVIVAYRAGLVEDEVRVAVVAGVVHEPHLEMVPSRNGGEVLPADRVQGHYGINAGGTGVWVLADQAACSAGTTNPFGENRPGSAVCASPIRAAHWSRRSSGIRARASWSPSKVA